MIFKINSTEENALIKVMLTHVDLPHNDKKRKNY